VGKCPYFFSSVLLVQIFTLTLYIVFNEHVKVGPMHRWEDIVKI
jgi:hypothetical protein